MPTLDLDELERLAKKPIRTLDELIILAYAVPELIAENRTLRNRVAEYSAELAALLGVKHDLEQRVRELEGTLERLEGYDLAVCSCWDCPARGTCEDIDKPCFSVLVDYIKREAAND